MYAPFFGLSKEPFSIAPDPHFLFLSDMHREALAHLLYGVSGGGGFVLLTGEIGAGKTTVCRAFLEQVPAHCKVAYIFNPRLTVGELLQTVCDEFQIARPLPSQGAGAPSVKDYVDALNVFLLAGHAAGLHTVLIIDEAQNLAADVLEQLRLLTNLETSQRKLLQIVLIGQPELREMLARPELEQLAQRVVARYHLPALSAAQTAQYIQHRLAVAGTAGRMPFDARGVARIHQLSGGVPRRINLLCDRSLLGAYAHGQTQVSRDTVEQAAREVFAPRRRTQGNTSRQDARIGPRATLALAGLAGAAVVMGLALLAAWVWNDAPLRGKAAAAGAAAGASAARAATGVSSPAAGKGAVLASVPGAMSGASGAGSAASTGLGTDTSAGPLTGAVLGGAAVAPSSTSSSPVSSPSRTAPAPAAAAPLADAGSVLAFAWRAEDAAWRELAPAWQAVLPAGDVCQQTAASGLACFRASGGLAVLRQLGRPGLLVLRDEAGEPAYVRLLALGASEVTLAVGERRWRLPQAALARIWRGEFATFWRPPPGWREGPDAATAAAARPWLQVRLAAAGIDEARLPLRERIRAFQAAQGLQPDGLAGPMTLMLLGRADGPRLALE